MPDAAEYHAELLRRMNERIERGIADAKARDPKACERCLRLGGAIYAIAEIETGIEVNASAQIDAEDQADFAAHDAAMQGALQAMYAVRDSHFGHEVKEGRA